jgi:hypothetical protein
MEIRDILSDSQKIALVKIDRIFDELINKGFESNQAQAFWTLLEKSIQRKMIVHLNRDALDFVEVIEKESDENKEG